MNVSFSGTAPAPSAGSQRAVPGAARRAQHRCSASDQPPLRAGADRLLPIPPAQREAFLLAGRRSSPVPSAIEDRHDLNLLVVILGSMPDEGGAL
jgi:hypothetical protein